MTLLRSVGSTAAVVLISFLGILPLNAEDTSDLKRDVDIAVLRTQVAMLSLQVQLATIRPECIANPACRKQAFVVIATSRQAFTLSFRDANVAIGRSQKAGAQSKLESDASRGALDGFKADFEASVWLFEKILK